MSHKAAFYHPHYSTIQVPVHTADVPKTAIITPFGSYVVHYSTFGLKNSGATCVSGLYIRSALPINILRLYGHKTTDECGVDNVRSKSHELHTIYVQNVIKCTSIKLYNPDIYN